MADAYKPINGGGLQQYPFNAHKRWVVTDNDYRQAHNDMSILKGISPLYNEKVPLSSSLNGINVADSSQLDNVNSNNNAFLASKEQKVIYAGLNQMFFKHRPNNERDLYTSASIFSIPHNRLGDGIKPLSVHIQDYSISNLYSDGVTIIDRKIDEYHGYLTDTALNTGSYVPFSSLVGYWGFNDEVVPRSTNFDKVILDRSGYTNHATGKNLVYELGILTEGTSSQPSGTKVTFNGTDSYIRIPQTPKYNFVKGNDYAISLWTDLPTSQSDASDDYNWVLSKRGTYIDYGKDKKLNDVTRRRNVESPIFPYDVKVYNQNTSNNGKVVISMSDGIRTPLATSTTLVNDGQHHVVLNKNGSLLELWVDGTKESSSSINLRGDVWNDYDILLGSEFLSDSGWDVTSNFKSLSGSLDEVRMYRRSLTQTEIIGLSDNDYRTGSAYQSDIVGEVFYNHGIAVVSDPRPKYKNVMVGSTGNWDFGASNGFTTKYKSTKKLFETSVLCEVNRNEFIISQNPTLRLNNDVNSALLKPFITGSDFNNYFTTIGLYNKEFELIAVGKLATAIKNRDEADITVKVRFDLDGAFGTPVVHALSESINYTISEEDDGSFVWNKQINKN